jgi:hypothetical protein
MKELISMPCNGWSQRLAARHRNDLTFTERVALNEHLASCQACTEVYAAYNTIETRIRSLPAVEPLPTISYRVLQLQKDAATSEKFMELASYLEETLIAGIAVLISLYSSLIRLRLHQKLKICAGILFSHFNRPVVYAWSNNHSMYAMRKDGNTSHWSHTRWSSGKNDLVSSSLPRGNGVTYMGSGVFYMSAVDFCRNAVQA